MESRKIGIHFIHPDALVTAGLKAILSAVDGLELSYHDAPDTHTDMVVIADYSGGVRFCQKAMDVYTRARHPVLIVTHRDREWEMRHALKCGVRGYVLQSSTPVELGNAVLALSEGGQYLTEFAGPVPHAARYNDITDREHEVLQLLGQGYCNKLIARELGIGVGTVKTHMSRLMAKLNVTARTRAVIVAAQRGLLHVEPDLADDDAVVYARRGNDNAVSLRTQRYY
jgi:DNA-binding NarL/FixJ family response regulator